MNRTAHYVLTLNGSAQSLATLLAGTARDFPICAISLQPRGSNANPIYVGARSDMTTSDYGVRLEASVGGVPSPPWEREFSKGPMQLGSFYVIGTNGEALHVFVVQHGPNG